MKSLDMDFPHTKIYNKISLIDRSSDLRDINTLIEKIEFIISIYISFIIVNLRFKELLLTYQKIENCY